jgi:photosystem II stability/assembly factor-like uncharacterized protein
MGYIVGEKSTIIKVIDGEIKWTNQALGSDVSLYSVCFSDPDTGYAVGMNGAILKTTNGGRDWIKQNSGTSNWLFSIYLIPKGDRTNVGYAVGLNGTILQLKSTK